MFLSHAECREQASAHTASRPQTTCSAQPGSPQPPSSSSRASAALMWAVARLPACPPPQASQRPEGPSSGMAGSSCYPAGSLAIAPRTAGHRMAPSCRSGQHLRRGRRRGRRLGCHGRRHGHHACLVPYLLPLPCLLQRLRLRHLRRAEPGEGQAQAPRAQGPKALPAEAEESPGSRDEPLDLQRGGSRGQELQESEAGSRQLLP
mmetsp:Transcript_36656/g.80335  ORF Transcript_36656/g.80335 Transcript_36656/m.80335 type:complete len:205 (-) Transcript_36656:2564-3178(-)